MLLVRDFAGRYAIASCYNHWVAQTISPSTKTPPPGKRLELIQAENLSRLSHVVHGFSTRNGGVSVAYGQRSLNLGITPEDTCEAVQQNRTLFLRAMGAADAEVWPLLTLKQIHSALIHSVDGIPHPQTGDALLTSEPGIVLAVRTADCLPVLVADRNGAVVGAIHAGWRGTLARITEKAIGAVRMRYGIESRDIFAAIGPGIHHCCYEVGEEVRDQFLAQFDHADTLFEEVFDSDAVHLKYPLLFLNQRAPGHGLPPKKLHLNLVEANRRQLLVAGIPEQNVWASELCTSCRTDLLFSHRAERGATGRLMGAIGIKPKN